MTVAQDDVIKAVWKVIHTTPNTIVENVFHWKVTDLVSGVFADVGTDIQVELEALFATITGNLSERYVLSDIRVTDLTQKLFVIDGVGAGFTGGGGAGEVLPAQDAAIVLARSRQQGHQGRKYLGPLLEAAVENGNLSAGALTTMFTFANKYENVFNGSVTTNEYTAGTAQIAVGGGLAGFTAFENGLHTALSAMRTQRSRRPGVGLS